MYDEFDWIEFCEQNLIEYIDRGANVGRGNIAIRCPFCINDPSHHMGLSLEGKGWGCWRDSDHSGKNPFRLVAELLGSRQRAMDLLKQQGGVPATTWDELNEMLTEEAVPATIEPMDRPSHMERLSGYKSHPALRYMKQRGFRKPAKTAKRFGLWVSRDRNWKGRIIFPITTKTGELLGWTGRAYGVSKVKYKVYPTGEGASGLVYAVQRPDKPEAVLIVEGPFDGLAAASVLPQVLVLVVQGISNHNSTLVALSNECPAGCPVHILFDRGAEAQAMALASRVPFLQPTVLVATEYDDLGEHFEHDSKGLRRFLQKELNLSRAVS